MSLPLDEIGSRRRQQGIKAFDNPRRKILVAGELSKSEGAVPGAHLGIDDFLRVLMRTYDEVLGHSLADFRRRSSSGPVCKIFLLCDAARASPDNNGSRQ